MIMTDEELVHLTGTAFAQLAVVESLAEVADLPSLLAKLTDPATRGDITDEDANVLGVYASCAMLAFSRVVDLIASYTDSDYDQYYKQWVRAEVLREAEVGPGR